MKLVDANILLYAVNENSINHDAAKRWLDGALSGAAPVGFAWVVLLAFLRISTHPSIFPTPLSPAEAVHQVRAWLASPSAQILNPTSRHATALTELVLEVGVGGNLITDAHLAALAREHRGDIVSFDRDFERFTGIHRIHPS